MDPIEGVDYSTDRPSIAGLANIGKRFACRYVGPGTSNKHLDPDEAAELIAHGLTVVANAEGFSNGLLGGWNTGVSWAEKAHAHAVRCGMPETRPIYLSVDFDVTADQWPLVADALRGAASVLGEHRVGVYGGYDAIAWSARDEVARWWWQTLAWSEGRWHPLAHIRQYRNTVSLVGGTVDLDQAMVADYGQWPIAEGDVDLMRTPQEKARDYNNSSILWGLANGADEVMILSTWEDPDHGGHVGVEGEDEYAVSLAPYWARVSKPSDETESVDLDELKAAIDTLVDAPLIDAVAVANAISAHPEIAAELAARVAERLATIEATIQLSGGLTGGIRPPAQ